MFKEGLIPYPPYLLKGPMRYQLVILMEFSYMTETFQLRHTLKVEFSSGDLPSMCA